MAVFPNQGPRVVMNNLEYIINQGEKKCMEILISIYKFAEERKENNRKGLIVKQEIIFTNNIF